MKKLMLLCTFLMLFILSGCGLFGLFDSDEEQEVAEGITQVTTIAYDEYNYRAYISTHSFSDTEDLFKDYLEDKGYIVADDYGDVEDFFMQQEGIGHGGVVYEDENDYKYVYFTGSDGNMQIFTLIADKETAQAHSNDNNDVTNGQDNDQDSDEFDMPTEDVSGNDLPVLERYPDSVRTSYTEVIEADDTDYYIEYVVEDTLENVYDFYETFLNDAGWDIDQQTFVPDEGAQFIAYLDGDYGLTLGIVIIEEGIIKIYVYATEYHEEA